MSAEELLEHVWDENADPFTQTVRVTVGTLRRKLSLAGEPQLLETVIGRGYRLRPTSRRPSHHDQSCPSWARTIRVRLALTYSALLFGITALILAGVYLALSQTIDAAAARSRDREEVHAGAADGTIATDR